MTYQLRDGRIIDESDPKYLQYKELTNKKYSIEKIAQELGISEGEVADFILMQAHILRQRALKRVKLCLDKGYSIKEIRAATGYTTKRIKDCISIIEDGEKD
nr:MAG TPA: Protein of unknown function (DUF1670) [Caudoviricetes sp.]